MDERRPTWRDLRSDVVQAGWERVSRWGAIGPRTRRGRRFGRFGEGSIICFPVNTVFNERYIHIGERTMIGPGVTLSAGQRQRIAIARAVLRDAPILLLDEATSALDSESETLVQRALDAIMQGRTTLVIAHRLATVTRADRILVLDEGRLVEEGTHQSLLANGGMYARLAELQFATDAA